MITSISKVVLAGILGGFLLFAIPFLIFKALFFFLILSLVFKLVIGRRHFASRRNYGHRAHFYDKYEIYEGKESLKDQINNFPKQI